MKKLTWTFAFCSLTLSTPILANAQTANPTPEVTTTTPRHRLVGVMLGSSQALLWDDEAAEYSLKRVGDEILGGRIISLEEDHLVIERDEETEVVGLSPPPQKRVAGKKGRKLPATFISAPEETDRKGNKTALAPAPSLVPTPPATVQAPVWAPAAPATQPPVAATPAAPPSVAAVQPSPPAPEAEAHQPISFPRSHLDREMDQVHTLGQRLRLTPHAGGGFRVLMVAPGSFLERVGIRQGDVVLRLDQRPLNRVEDIAQAAAWLRLTDKFTVDILREGRAVTMHYAIQQS